MKELHVTIKLRNNRLKRRREELGMSAPAFAEAVGLGYCTYIRLESMLDPPTGKGGHWREAVQKIADFHGLSPEELFPPVVRAVAQSKVSRELDGADVGRFVSEYQRRVALPPSAPLEDEQTKGVVLQALDVLTPRERQIIKARFGLDGGEPQTQEEIAGSIDRTRALVHVMQTNAMRKLAKCLGGDTDASRANGFDPDRAARRTAAIRRAEEESARVRAEVEAAARKVRAERLAKARATREKNRLALAARTPEQIEAEKAAKEAKRKAQEAERLAAAEAERKRQAETEEAARIHRERYFAPPPIRPSGAHAWDWIWNHRVWRCDNCKALAWPIEGGFSYSDTGDKRLLISPPCDPKRWLAYQQESAKR